jgi:2-iminobutanoate/2-iminopropanoate deaminase
VARVSIHLVIVAVWRVARDRGLSEARDEARLHRLLVCHNNSALTCIDPEIARTFFRAPDSRNRESRATMSNRKSFDVEGLGHANPIPAVSRIGNIVATGGVSGADRKTGKVPEDAAAQCANMFANLRAILAAAGATSEDVIRVTVWIKRPEIRAEVNKEWVVMFPDPHSRPARHTMFYDQFAGGMVVQCEAWAVIGE